MRHLSLSQTMRCALPYALASIALLFMAPSAIGQDTPLITGGVSFFSSTNKGPTSYDPVFMPAAVVPITHHFLFETRESFVEIVNPRKNAQSDQTRLNRNVIYLQGDLIVSPHLTIVGGKFLTPFGTYNERLSPIWINNFQDGPMDLSIGSLGTAGTGGEIRGSLFSNAKVNVDYASFFSATVGGKYFASSRATGDRVEAYFPGAKVDVGMSFDRMFKGAHPNAYGTHLWWEPGALTVRSEYAHGTHSQGYWIETGYRLSRFKGPNSLIGRAQPLFRMQQTFRNSPDSTDGLSAVDTQRADFGFDYYLPKEWRIITSYSRVFASNGNGNIWKTGLVYHFLFPAWPGKQ